MTLNDVGEGSIGTKICDTSEFSLDYYELCPKMPVNPVPNAPPPTGVLAYNGDSPRGWNDPPTFAFSGHNSTGSRPKLDLRKRVSHHQALHGTRTHPPNPSSPTTYAGTEVSDRIASLSLQSPPVTTGCISPLPSSTTPAILSKVMHNPYIAPPSVPSVPVYTHPTTYSNHEHENRSHSMPSIYMPTVSPELISTPNINTTSTEIRNHSPIPTTQAPVHLGQPLFALRDHCFEPVKTHNDSGVRSTAEIGDHLDDHCHGNQQPEIFHPVPLPVSNGVLPAPPVGNVTPPLTTAPPGHVSPVPLSTRALSPHPSIPVTNTSHFQGGMGHGITTNAPPVGHYTPPLTTQPNQPPVTTTPVLGIPTMPVGLRTPTPPGHTQFISPGSLSTGSTPRCLSPEEEDSICSMSDEEGLKATVDALNDVIQKYKLQKRVCDDVAKKLQVMSKMWRQGKLGKTVKSRMIKLAKALDDGEGEVAHHIHVSIIVDHVAEVNQWMVAVKRLISVVRHAQKS